MEGLVEARHVEEACTLLEKVLDLLEGNCNGVGYRRGRTQNTIQEVAQVIANAEERGVEWARENADAI